MLNSIYDKLIPIIQKEAKARGYKYPSVIIGQAIQESGARTVSTLASKYMNFWGMKCGSSWRGKSVNLKTKECYNGADYVTIRENFRVYDSLEEAVRGYFDFISVKRYANLKDAKTPEEYAILLKQDGWATGLNYSEHVIKNIYTYGLLDYDQDTISVEDKTAKKNTIKSAVILIQNTLNEVGYNLSVDGIFGPKTKEAYDSFRKS